MKRITLIAMVLMAGMAFGQDATVVELSKSDADQAKQLYEAKQAADKAWDKAYAKIVAKYKGFPSGADFSKDFRFIVPKAYQSPAINWSPCCSLPTIPITQGSGDLYFRTAPLISPSVIAN